MNPATGGTSDQPSNTIYTCSATSVFAFSSTTSSIVDKLDLPQNAHKLSTKSDVRLEEDILKVSDIVSADISPSITLSAHLPGGGSPHSANITQKDFYSGRLDCTHEVPATATFAKSSTDEVISRPVDSRSEVELISLLEEKIPRYKLRVDTITEFTGYQHHDWLIETPLIDLDAPIDLNPTLLRETLKYFLQSSKRLSQMTKVYNDTEALTRLLEEKERDLELAARIGQSLLDQNSNQSNRIDELEKELSIAKEKIIQLNHEITSKKDLLQIYLKNEQDEEEEDDELFYSFHENSSICDPRSPGRTAQLLNELERRVGTLENENQRLKNETDFRENELEIEERKEQELIEECTRRLSLANKQLLTLQEECSRKSDENSRLQSDITNLTSQVTSLEKQVRRLTIENEELESALHLARECQSELSLELIDVKEKHSNLLMAFHEKQEECRLLTKKHSISDSFFPYADSLAYELEQSLHDTVSHIDICDATNYALLDSANHGRCITPDSALSIDSLYANSPYTSFHSTSGSLQNEINKSSCSHSTNTSVTTLAQVTTSLTSTVSVTTESKTISRNLFLSDKLRYIKPLEGSQILHHWRRLASPNLNNLFEDKDKYISRIKANLAASEVKISSSNKVIQVSASNTVTTCTDTSGDSDVVSLSLANNFVTTNSVFTFTTTSVSQTKESVTHVTSTFSNVQPSTGKANFSIDFHSLNAFRGQASVESPCKLAHSTSCALSSRPSLVTSQIKTDSSAPINTGPYTGTNVKRTAACGSDNASAIDQLMLQPLSGLNELSKLINTSANTFSMFKPLNSNRRIITKMMATANDLLDQGSHSSLADRFHRMDLSVLRNLRKGGLI